MPDWLREHAWWLAILSGAVGLVFVLSGYAVLMRLPEDYFLRQEENTAVLRSRSGRHSMLLIFRNLVGIAMIVMGGILALPLVPGPGLILMILGLSMTNFPGKQKLKLGLLRTPVALNTVNWLRRKTGRPPLRLPLHHLP
jgi:hypothetical protein